MIAPPPAVHAGGYSSDTIFPFIVACVSPNAFPGTFCEKYAVASSASVPAGIEPARFGSDMITNDFEILSIYA